jgi:hypothetical protein
VRNLKRIKQATINWAYEKKIKEEHELCLIEESLQEMQEVYGKGFHTQADKENLVNLEKR